MFRDYTNLFPDYEASVQAQQMLAMEDWKEIMVEM